MPTDTAQIQGVRDYLHGVDATLERLQKVLSTLTLPELAVPTPGENGDETGFRNPEVRRRATAKSRHASAVHWRRMPAREQRLKIQFLTAMHGLPKTVRVKLRNFRRKFGYASAIRAAHTARSANK